MDSRLRARRSCYASGVIWIVLGEELYSRLSPVPCFLDAGDVGSSVLSHSYLTYTHGTLNTSTNHAKSTEGGRYDLA
jgi:hypothetical protein